MSAFKTFLCLFPPFCSCKFNNFSCPARAFPLLLKYLSPVNGFSVFNLFVYFLLVFGVALFREGERSW